MLRRTVGICTLWMGVLMLTACKPDVTAFVTTLVTRMVPVPGAEVLAAAPIAHGDPASESEFVHATDRSPMESYEDLGELKEGAAIPRLLRNNLGIESSRSHAASVFYALHASDVQVVDEKSPGITPTNDFGLDGLVLQGSYRPHSPYLPHMANVLVHTANMLAKRSRPYDLAIHTGDAIENAQKNELQMFFTLFNGGTVYPDSGDIMDLIPGPHNDPNDVFIAVGLQNTPWYSVIGNHDVLGQGNFPLGLLHFFNAPGISDVLQRSFGMGGLSIPAIATAAERRDVLKPTELYLMSSPGLLAGLNKKLVLQDLLSRTKLARAFKDFFNQGQLAPQSITPDLERAQNSRCGFIEAHLKDNGVPKGHGFTASLNSPVNNRCVGHYSFTPPSHPLFRFVTLDFSSEYGGDEGVFGLPQQPFNLAALLDTSGKLKIDLANEAAMGMTSTGYSSNTQGLLLVRPTTIRPLFLVPERQGKEAGEDFQNSYRNQLLFLQHELAEARKNDQLVVVASHHASEGLYTYNKLRVQIENIICNQLKNAVDSSLDCDYADGTQATGNPGDSVAGADAKGNVQARDLFAMIVGVVLEESIYSFEDLQQAHIDTLALKQPKVFDGLVSAFNLLFSVRNLLPDPILPRAPMNTSNFRRLLAANPHVILHVAGHSHQHKILAICNNGVAIHATEGLCSDVGGTAGKGYYEVRTAANADWPQEWRILEFADNNDGTLSIFATVFGPAYGKDALADAGRRLALADIETIPGRNKIDHPQDLNVELVVPITSTIDQKLDGVPNRHARIESLTTLRDR